MKKQVQQYKTLAEKLQAGEEVSFGQMEKVFAPAFLENFLKRILGGQEREKLRALNRNAIAEAYQGEDIDPDQLEPSNRQIVAQEVELVRMVSGALGVRPTLNDLSNYLQESIRSRNWELMNKILSLSQEGRLERGILERAALEDLVNDRTQSYQELKKAFPDLQFSRELVLPAYDKVLRTGRYECLQTIKAETGVPIPEQPVQDTYQTVIDLLERDSTLRQHKSFREFNDNIGSRLEALEKLHEITQVALPKTQETNQQIAALSASEDLHSSHIEKINDLFGLYTNPELAQKAQEAALTQGNLSGFVHLYKRSSHKLASQKLQAATDALYQQSGAHRTAELIEETHVAPSEGIWKRLCSDILRSNNFSQLEHLSQITGESLSFEQNALDEGISSRGNSFSNICEYVRMLGKVGAAVFPASLNEALMKYLRYRVERGAFVSEIDIKEVRDFYGEINIKKTKEIAELQIEGAVSELERKLRSHEKKFSKPYYDDQTLSPLVPVERQNIKEYRAFARAATSACKACLDSVRQLKKEEPGARASVSASDAYAPALEIMLVQAGRGECLLPLDELIKETGIAPSQKAYQRALTHHLARVQVIPENPGSMLESIAQKTGTAIEVSDDEKDALVREVLDSKPYCNMHNRLAYARALLGGFQVTSTLRADIEQVAVGSLIQGNANVYRALVSYIGGTEGLSQTSQESIKLKAREALQEMNAARYDYLKGNSDLSFSFDESDKRRIQSSVIETLINDPDKHREVKAINERMGSPITATSQELKRIVAAYFGGSIWNNHPQQIAKSLCQQLDQEQISNRVIEFVGNNEEYEAKELIKNTGIAPSSAQMDYHLQRAPNLVERTRYLWKFVEISPTYKPESGLVDEMYTGLYEGKHSWNVNRLLDLTKQLPPQQIVNSILQKSWEITLRGEEGDRYINDLTKILLKKYRVTAPYDMSTLKQSVLQRQQYLLDDVYRKRRRASEVHQLALELSAVEQETLLQRLDSDVCSSAYTPLKKGLSTALMECACAYAPTLFSHSSVREKAAQRAAELFGSEKGNMYRGFAYAILSGVQPKFTHQQYQQYKKNLQGWGYQLRKCDFEYLQKNMETWKPEAV